MKKMLTIISALLILLTSSLALAQDSDLIGLYFDPLGDMDCLDANELVPYQPFDMYLILKDPSFDLLYGFESGLTIDGPVMFINGLFTNPQALNVGHWDSIIAGFGTPSVMEPINILYTFTMIYTSTTAEPVCFKVHGTQPSSIDPIFPTLLLADGEMMSVMVNYGPDAECTAWIQDGPCGVATTVHTWDSLKTLYR